MPEEIQGSIQNQNDRQEFREFLIKRHLTKSEIDQAVDLINRFEMHLTKPAHQASTDETRSFIQFLANEKKDSEENISYLFFFGKCKQNNELALASLHFWDGCEVMENLYKKTGESFGIEIRDKVFAGIERPSIGASSLQKARTMQVIMDRIEQLADPTTIIQLLSDCLRDLSDEPHLEDRKRYAEIGDFDAFLEMKRQEYVQYLEGIKDRGELYFTQEITDEVVAFVRDNPEVAQGIRVGNILYITKIPYMTKEYLAEMDEEKKRYYYCHCPWARETLKQGEKVVSATFCHCSAGFVKKPWEVILGQKLEVDILESILQGDQRCRFAIHLPEGVYYPE